MDFFESQDRARRSTWLLIFYFVLAVVSMIAAIYAATLFALGYFNQQADEPAQFSWWQPQLLAIVAVVVLAIISLGSLFKTFQLRGGGAKVAEMLGGRRLHPYSEDLKEQRLRNVVEEMALASGVPVPPVYVLDREDGINAFAAGFTPDDAVIGVNRGTLNYLNRDELQGVLAHEFSHILNGDMRLNLRLIGILHGILVLAIIGYYVLRVGAFSGGSRSSKKGGGMPILIIGIAMLVVGYLGLFFGRLIKAAVSRQREYLADASAVQFTRNPDGIAGALKKIGGLAGGSKMKTPEAESASHMFFGSAMKWMSGGVLATHPPLVERIQKIDPQFKGKFPTVTPLAEQEETPVTAEVVETPSREHAFGAFGRGEGGEASPFGVTPALILASVGQTDGEHVQFARQLLMAIPEEIRQTLHDPFGARTAIFALLLDEDDAVRAEQLEIIRRREGEPTQRETERLAVPLRELGKEFRLPVINLAQSTLCELSPGQYDSFRGTVERLVQADKMIDLFEFVIQRVLLEHLDRHFHEKKPPKARYFSITAVQRQIECLLSALAHLGHDSEDEARGVFQQAMATLEVSGEMLTRRDCTLRQIGDSLDKLNECSFAVKKRTVAAAIASVTADGQITIAEAELLRAIADSIGCPMPPILSGFLSQQDEAATLPREG